MADCTRKGGCPCADCSAFADFTLPQTKSNIEYGDEDREEEEGADQVVALEPMAELASCQNSRTSIIPQSSGSYPILGTTTSAVAALPDATPRTVGAAACLMEGFAAPPLAQEQQPEHDNDAMAMELDSPMKPAPMDVEEEEEPAVEGQQEP